ncbi:MAG: alanine--tRNA ligase, partial [Campylobacterales bacterium]|nr:alanine--tRNA ligase [Campylobacterales bacterium]
NYHSSLFMPYIEVIESLVELKYNYNDPKSASFRVIADHLRSCSFLLAQGVNFDKEGRGYVLRRIMRRAIRHGYLLGLRAPFMYKLVDVLVTNMGGHYAYLETQKESIKSAMMLEEERFFETIDAGISLFQKELENTKDIFSGEVAFKLYDTYGFPLDLTQDMLREQNISLDMDTFDKQMSAQREMSKASWKGSGDAINSGDFKELLEAFGINEFVGYEATQAHSKVIALLDEDFKRVQSIQGSGWVMLDKTPFYAESGGQCGDTGSIDGTIKVIETRKFLELNLSHFEGVLSVDDKIEAVVDNSRAQIAKHHSATHLLHAALREILGTHIAQAGSLVEATRLRFDFSHPKALTKSELTSIEAWVNDKIDRALRSDTHVTDIETAKQKGAIALFGEKYADEVRMVDFEGASVELCGGIHVANTSEIGVFLITKESGVSAGVRRIEAICAKEAQKYIAALRSEFENIKEEVKNQDVLLGITKLKDQIKELKNELASAQSATKQELKGEVIDGVNVIVDTVQNGDIKMLIDDAKNKYEHVAIMLIQPKDDKVLIACGIKGVAVKAGAWIKEIAPILGGGGGGRDDFAQAGGKDISKIEDALNASREYIKRNL